MIRYLSQAEVAARIGVESKSLGRAKLPRPDVVIGQPPDDLDSDTWPRGVFRGWLPETVDAWAATRPKRGRPRSK